MKTALAWLVVFLLCVTTQFGKVAFGASKIPVNEIKAVAFVVENKETGEKNEIDNIDLPEPGVLWALVDTCKNASKEYAERKNLSDWSYKCCPVTADGTVHCESPLGR